MRIFLAGATGVIGVRLLPLMAAEGHAVAAMTGFGLASMGLDHLRSLKKERAEATIPPPKEDG